MAETGKPIPKEPEKPKLDFDEVMVGEEVGTFEYILTEEQLARFRECIEDPEALFPTIAVRHDSSALSMKYKAGGSVKARNLTEFFNPPIPGKKIRVTGRIVDKYIRREKPYLVIQATAVDEDGMLIERTTTHQMRKPEEVGKKWG